MDITLIEAFGNSTAVVDNLNNLLTFGSNSHGQLGLDQHLKPASFDNCHNSLQRINKSLINLTIVQLYGAGNTFGFLTKQNQVFICGEFAPPIDKIKAEAKGNQQVIPKGAMGILGSKYSQNLLKPTQAKFLEDPKQRFKIKKFALTHTSVALIANDASGVS